MNGIELSRRYFTEAALPLLNRQYPELSRRIAAGLVAGGFDSGCGSEIGGFDDEISRDHNWGPRFFLFMSEQDKQSQGKDVVAYLERNLPTEFSGFSSSATTLPKNPVYVQTPQENLEAVLHLDGPPKSDVEWITIPEVWLFEYTAGPIYYEPVPLVSPVRDKFAYYPDDVWLKRLSYAFFMLHLSGNVNRAVRRKDAFAIQTYVNWLLQIVMRTCFLLNRRYAPYCKWLFKAFCGLPDLPVELRGKIESLALHIEPATVMDDLYCILDAVGVVANRSGVINNVPLRKKSPFIWTDFNCYGFMHAFHERISGPLKESNPYEHGPLDLQVANGPVNREVMATAWKTMKNG